MVMEKKNEKRQLGDTLFFVFVNCFLTFLFHINIVESISTFPFLSIIFFLMINLCLGYSSYSIYYARVQSVKKVRNGLELTFETSKFGSKFYLIKSRNTSIYSLLSQILNQNNCFFQVGGFGKIFSIKLPDTLNNFSLNVELWHHDLKHWSASYSFFLIFFFFTHWIGFVIGGEYIYQGFLVKNWWMFTWAFILFCLPFYFYLFIYKNISIERFRQSMLLNKMTLNPIKKCN